jgi:IS5 family transposase
MFGEVSLKDLVPADHAYVQIKDLVDFEELTRPLKGIYSELGRGGYPLSQGFRCLVIQFLNDLSDRALEAHLRDSLSAKYFCGFSLREATPDHSYFGRLRERIGIERLAELFNRFQASMKQAGLISEVFTFVDASRLYAMIDTWKARDRAIADEKNDQKDDDGNPTMNNKNIEQYSSDPDARYGAKGKKDYWVGYKRHVSVDMKHGLIHKTEITPANHSDAQSFPAVCPDAGMVFADKAYATEEIFREISARGCASGIILKNNSKTKNRELDRWRASVRMPFENVFSKLPQKTRFRGLQKNHFLVLFQALAYNLKKIASLKPPTFILVPT